MPAPKRSTGPGRAPGSGSLAASTLPNHTATSSSSLNAAAAPCSGTNMLAKRAHHSDSSSRQRHQHVRSKTQTCNSSYTCSNPNSFATWGNAKRKDHNSQKKSAIRIYLPDSTGMSGGRNRPCSSIFQVRSTLDSFFCYSRVKTLVP